MELRRPKTSGGKISNSTTKHNKAAIKTLQLGENDPQTWVCNAIEASMGILHCDSPNQFTQPLCDLFQQYYDQNCQTEQCIPSGEPYNESPDECCSGETDGLGNCL